MHPALPTAACRATIRLTAAIVCTLSVLLAGCAPTDQGTFTRSVEAIYEDAQGLSPEQLASHKAHDVAVLEWAAELGLVEPWNESELRRDHEATSEKKSYGVTDMILWEFYTERIGQTEDLLKTHVRDSLSLDEVRSYYDQHIDQFARQDVLTITVVPWRDGRAGDASTLTIDEESVRLLQEQDDELIAAALDLQTDEETVVELADGSYFQVTCNNRVEAGHEPFDDVTQAALSQLTTERFDAEVQRRIDSSENG